MSNQAVHCCGCYWRIYCYLSKISSEIWIFNVGYMSTKRSVFTAARMWGSVVIFRSQNGVREQKSLGNADRQYIAFMVDEHINMGYSCNGADNWKTEAREKKKTCPSVTHLASGTRKGAGVWNKNGKATRTSVTQLTSSPPEITKEHYKHPSNSVAKDSLLSDSTKRLYQTAVQASGFQTVNRISVLKGPQNGSSNAAHCKWNIAVIIKCKCRS